MAKMSNEIQDPTEDPMLEPVAEETQYRIMAKLLDDTLLEMTSYIKDDKDLKKIMMIRTHLEAYVDTMQTLCDADQSVNTEANQIVKVYTNHVVHYLKGMIIRKGWRPEQIAGILSAHERLKKKSMALFEDPQMKGVNEIKRVGL